MKYPDKYLMVSLHFEGDLIRTLMTEGFEEDSYEDIYEKFLPFIETAKFEYTGGLAVLEQSKVHKWIFDENKWIPYIAEEMKK